MASDTVKKSQNIILKQDWSQTVISARNHTSLKHILFAQILLLPAGAVTGMEILLLPAGAVTGIEH